MSGAFVEMAAGRSSRHRERRPSGSRSSSARAQAGPAPLSSLRRGETRRLLLRRRLRLRRRRDPSLLLRLRRRRDPGLGRGRRPGFGAERALDEGRAVGQAAVGAEELVLREPAPRRDPASRSLPSSARTMDAVAHASHRPALPCGLRFEWAVPRGDPHVAEARPGPRQVGPGVVDVAREVDVHVGAEGVPRRGLVGEPAAVRGVVAERHDDLALLDGGARPLELRGAEAKRALVGVAGGEQRGVQADHADRDPGAPLHAVRPRELPLGRAGPEAGRDGQERLEPLGERARVARAGHGAPSLSFFRPRTSLATPRMTMRPVPSAIDVVWLPGTTKTRSGPRPTSPRAASTSHGPAAAYSSDWPVAATSPVTTIASGPTSACSARSARSAHRRTRPDAGPEAEGREARDPRGGAR